jgi:hypothetical protein
MYIGFQLSEPNYGSCSRLAEVMGLSHDSVNRFLLRENYTPHDLFQEVKPLLTLRGGTLSVDDTVLDKPYSFRMALVGYFWSGKHHQVVKGINLITLYYSDVEGRHLPVNYRVYDKSEGKTKNEYFREMLAEVLAWGLSPAFVTGDSWYSGEENLKTVKHHQTGFLFAVERNRRVAMEKGQWTQVQHLDIPAEGRLVWLHAFGEVKLFRTWLKDEPRHYIVYLPDADHYATFERQDFQRLHDQHWHIEQYHRIIKQVCHIERFHVRGKVPILNHIFATQCAYLYLHQLRVTEVLMNVYRLQRDLFKEAIAAFIRTFIIGKDHLSPHFCATVNA